MGEGTIGEEGVRRTQSAQPHTHTCMYVHIYMYIHTYIQYIHIDSRVSDIL